MFKRQIALLYVLIIILLPTQSTSQKSIICTGIVDRIEANHHVIILLETARVELDLVDIARLYEDGMTIPLRLDMKNQCKPS